MPSFIMTMIIVIVVAMVILMVYFGLSLNFAEAQNMNAKSFAVLSHCKEWIDKDCSQSSAMQEIIIEKTDDETTYLADLCEDINQDNWYEECRNICRCEV